MDSEAMSLRRDDLLVDGPRVDADLPGAPLRLRAVNYLGPWGHPKP